MRRAFTAAVCALLASSAVAHDEPAAESSATTPATDAVKLTHKFTVSLFPHASADVFAHGSYRRPPSRLPSSSSSLKTGHRAGHRQRLPRRPRPAARPGPMSASGPSKSPPSTRLSWATSASSRSPRRPTMPSLRRSPRPLGSARSRSSSSTKSNTSRAATVVVATLSCLKTVSRTLAANSTTRRRGRSCLVPT